MRGGNFTKVPRPLYLERVPAALVFTVPPANDTKSCGYDARLETPDGCFALPSAPESQEGFSYVLPPLRGESPFVAHEIKLGDAPAQALERSRFRFVVGAKSYAAGTWGLAQAGLRFHRPATIGQGDVFSLTTTGLKSERADSPVYFYLIGEWGRPLDSPEAP